MRLFVFAFSFTLSLNSPADTVQLEPLNSSKSRGSITIFNSNRSEANYNFNAAKLNKDYGILVYEKGNCSSFSSPVQVLATHPTEINKTVPFSLSGSQFLIYHAHHNSESLNRGGATLSGVGSFLTLDLKGKILVLVEMDNPTSSTGTPVACGVHP